MDLHRFFNHSRKSSKVVTWDERLNFLYELAMGIATIHSHDLVHRDLHSGNILYQRTVLGQTMNFGPQFANFGKVSITDFGLCHSVNNNTTNIYGVLPFIAPEVLKGKPFTKASDVYSFGSLMYVLGTGYTPFHNRQFSNSNLCFQILNGKRPPPIKGAPKFYESLMRNCWDKKPENRLTMEEIAEEIKTWVHSPNEPSEEIKREIEEAEKFLKTYPPTNISNSYPEISQLLPINGNSSKNEISLSMYFKYCTTISSLNFSNILTFNITILDLGFSHLISSKYYKDAYL
jgi:serine/threonine protein kinase